MNVFIVHAHENPNSFSSALKNQAEEFYRSNNYDIEISDLYSMNFNPIAGANDFKTLSGTSHYKLQSEQINAFNNDLYVDEVKSEMIKLENADLIILNFPLWWFSLPAILKGWIDRVFAMGFVYGAGKGTYENGIFKNKKAFLTITAGAAEESFMAKGANGEMDKILFHINHGILYFIGMQVLPPFIVYGPAKLTGQQRIDKLEDYKKYLANINNIKPLYPGLNN